MEHFDQGELAAPIRIRRLSVRVVSRMIAEAHRADIDRAARIRSKWSRFARRKLQIGTRKAQRSRRRARLMHARRVLAASHNNALRTIQRDVLPAYQMLAVRMEPQRWYRRPDMVALLPEYSVNLVDCLVRVWLEPRSALVRRRDDKGFRWRLSANGLRLASEWREALDGPHPTSQR
jgi:hypothetical protein